MYKQIGNLGSKKDIILKKKKQLIGNVRIMLEKKNMVSERKNCFDKIIGRLELGEESEFDDGLREIF